MYHPGNSPFVHMQIHPHLSVPSHSNPKLNALRKFVYIVIANKLTNVVNTVRTTICYLKTTSKKALGKNEK